MYLKCDTLDFYARSHNNNRRKKSTHHPRSRPQISLTLCWCAPCVLRSDFVAYFADEYRMKVFVIGNDRAHIVVFVIHQKSVYNFFFNICYGERASCWLFFLYFVYFMCFKSWAVIFYIVICIALKFVYNTS